MNHRQSRPVMQERMTPDCMKTGKIPERVLNRSVLKQLHTKRSEIRNSAGIGGDCAIFAPGQGSLLATHVGQGSLSVAIMENKGVEEAFWYRTITGCVNNLAASGAQPLGAMISLTLPEQIEEKQLKRLVAAAEKVCSSYGMQIAGGHISVSDQVQSVMAVVTVYGAVSPDRSVPGGEGCGEHLPLRGVGPDQDVVVSKWIGLEGTALIAGKCSESLLKRYPAWLVEEAVNFKRYLSVLPEAAVALKSGVWAMHDASEGGIFAALWELSQSTGVGLSIDLRKLPVRQETIEVCECLGINPYGLMSGGALVMITEDGPALVRKMKEHGVSAAWVGRTTQSKERIITNDGEVRYLDRPGEDEIRKIFPGDGDMVFKEWEGKGQK